MSERCLICGRKGLHFCLDVERPDYDHTPGREATLRIGPFAFGANTADGGSIGFSIEVGRWGFVVSAGTVR